MLAVFPHDDSLVWGPLSAGATASNIMFVGINSWCVTVPMTGSLTGFTVQANNSRLLLQGGSISPMSSGMYGDIIDVPDPTFESKWVNVRTSISSFMEFTAPWRYVRIVNSSTGQMANLQAYLFKSYINQAR